jgi:hypothetical protein
MIPREILKKIRQIELRTVRGIHALALEASRKALLKVRWISRAMEHRQNGKDILFNREVDAVFAESTKPNLARTAANPAEHSGVCLRTIQCPPDLLRKFPTQPGPDGFIPDDRLLKFMSGGRLEQKGPAHFQPYFSRSSALIVSQGIPWWGFCSNSASRRSNSAACSGERSGSAQSSSAPNSVQICSTTWRFSSAGSRRICSMISIALMTAIYLPPPGRQAAFDSSLHP